jgi:formylglycine-generating enzyme required for sulfatase activity
MSVTLGFGAWYVLGKNPATATSKTPSVISEAAPNASTKSSNSTDRAENAADSSNSSAVKTPPPETVDVPGAVIEIGGDESTPAKKIAVDSFFIAETEVTNQQYQEFVRATGHKAPVEWKDGEFTAGAANEPVIGVTWQDAIDYCNWLSTKSKTTVRLPTEAEWELAARGSQGLKYPWGNDWDDRAAASEGKNGFVHAVKSYPAGRASCGAYDLAGNVWEWVSDDVKAGSAADTSTQKRIIKGGAANENRDFITATSRNTLPQDHSSRYLGFRYVVSKK